MRGMTDSGLEGLVRPTPDPHRRTDVGGFASGGGAGLREHLLGAQRGVDPGGILGGDAAVIRRFESGKFTGMHPDLTFGMEGMIKSHMRDGSARKEKIVAFFRLRDQTIAIHGHGSYRPDLHDRGFASPRRASFVPFAKVVSSP